MFSTPVKKIGISGRTKNYRVRARLKGVAMSLEMAKIKFELCYVIAVSYKYPNTKKSASTLVKRNSARKSISCVGVKKKPVSTSSMSGQPLFHN